MKPGFCYIAERNEPGQALRRTIETFAWSGIVLANPHTGRITELGDEGDQRDTTEGELTRAVELRRHATYQLWFSSGTDVVCSFKRLERGIVRHAYSLDGLDAEERECIARWAIEYFRRASMEEDALLLVADPPGETADVDWDAVAGHDAAFPLVLPAVLGLPSSRVGQLPVLREYRREQLGGFELVTRQRASE